MDKKKELFEAPFPISGYVGSMLNNALYPHLYLQALAGNLPAANADEDGESDMDELCDLIDKDSRTPQDEVRLKELKGKLFDAK